jgi:hypothetical protein
VGEVVSGFDGEDVVGMLADESAEISVEVEVPESFAANALLLPNEEER